MVTNFFWIPVIELLWGIGFIFVLIFNFIVDYWWVILLIMGLWCVVGYMVNYGPTTSPKAKLKKYKTIKPTSKSNDKHVNVQEVNKVLGSKWAAFINSTFIMQFISEDIAMFYQMDCATFDHGHNPIYYIKYKIVDNAISFDGSGSIRGESYVFENGSIKCDTLKISYRETTDGYQWRKGVFRFGKVSDNGEVPIVYND